MYILDTNVLSELIQPREGTLVSDWLNGRRRTDLFTTTVNMAEILFGLALMPKGRRRSALIVAADAMFAQDFADRVLHFDVRAAGHYAGIAADRVRAGRSIGPIDAQIAAIARANGMAVATRNVRDFDECGVDVINPWEP